MSFQLAVLLVALELESGRSSAESRSISISASGSSSSGGGSTRRGGVREGGGRDDDRPEAMCLSRTGRRHKRRIYLFDDGRGRDRSGDSGPWKKQPNCWIQPSALQLWAAICRYA